MGNIQLHVGYIGITREGKRVEITELVSGDGTYPWGSTYATYTNQGFLIAVHDSPLDIVGPWVNPQVETPVEPQVNYNDGKWHRWDGATAECPVHGSSTVEVNYIDGEDHTIIDERRANSLNWDSTYEPILAFRVTKEYVAPVEPREFWIQSVGNGLADVKTEKPSDMYGYIHVREVI